MRHKQDNKHISADYRLPTLPVRVQIELHTFEQWLAVQEKDDIRLFRDPSKPVIRRDMFNDPLIIPASRCLSEFLSLREPTSAIRFLGKFSALGLTMFLDDKRQEVPGVYWSEILAFQEALVVASATPVERWNRFESSDGFLPLFSPRLITPVAVEIETDGSIVGVCSSDVVSQQCVCAVFFDKLEDIELRHCASPNCSNVFRRATKHDKIFCSEECSHYMAVRYSRGLAKPLSRRKNNSKKRR